MTEPNFLNPPMHTSVNVPPQGFVVVRFLANNPGIWPMHCHILAHMMQGQFLVLRVADQGVPPVPDHFPSCPVRGVQMEGSTELVDLDLIGA